MSSTLSNAYTDNIGAIYVSLNETLDVNYEFVPSDYNCSFIDFDISKIEEPFSANITYWKEINDVDIVVTTNQPIYQDLENGTWLETYSYTIENNEDINLEVVALDFDRLMYANVDAETTKVYSQGKEYFTSFVYTNRRLTLYIPIGSTVPLNLTITVQSNTID